MDIKSHGIGKIFASMEFNWRRWVLREHTTQFIWLVGITLILLINYPELTGQNTSLRNLLMGIISGSLLIIICLFPLLEKDSEIQGIIAPKTFVGIVFIISKQQTRFIVIFGY